MLLLLGLSACKLLLRNVLSRAESNSVSHSTLLGKNNNYFVCRTSSNCSQSSHSKNLKNTPVV